MNKTELVAAIAEQAEISKKDAEKALKAFKMCIRDRSRAYPDRLGMDVEDTKEDFSVQF